MRLVCSSLLNSERWFSIAQVRFHQPSEPNANARLEAPSWVPGVSQALFTFDSKLTHVIMARR